MRQATVLLTIGALAACTSAANAQSWVKFSNQTSSRLVAAANVGASNVDEKDYDYGDLDADGDIDLVCVMKQPFTSPGKRRNVLYMNEGTAQGHAINGVLVDRTGNFAPQMLDLTNDRDVVVFDVNGDGWLDVVTATTLSGVPQGTNGDKHNSHPRVYINQGQSNGQPHSAGLTSTWLGLSFDDDARVPLEPTEPRFCSVSAGDIDNDGDADLYFGDYQQGGSRSQDLNDRLWINNGNGYFTDESTSRMTAEMLESSFGMATVMADMNNDGFLDILKDDALNAPQAVSTSYNNPANPGFFSVYDLTHDGFTPYHVVVGNLNNDGLLDMVVSDDFSDRFRLGTSITGGKLNSTVHTFSFQGSGGDDGFGSDNYIFDLDNDGWNDVLICDVDVDISGNDGCSDGRRLHIYRNRGGIDGVSPGGVVNLQEQVVGGEVVGGISTAMCVGTHDVAVFDINGDGWKDMVIGRCSGTQVWINQPPDGLQFTYPGGLPSMLEPAQGETFQVQLNGADGGVPVAGTGVMHLSVNGGSYTEIPMNHLGGNLYEASLPAGDCADTYRFFFSGETALGGEFFDPPNGPAEPYVAFVAQDILVMVDDRIEGDVSGWTVTNHATLTSGAWQVAVPVGSTTATTLLQAAPGSDAGTAPRETKAWVTQNGLPGGAASTADIDGGPTRLVTPQFNLDGTDGIVEYDRWFFTEGGVLDSMQVEISNDDGANWVLVENVTTAASQWIHHSFQVSSYVVGTAQMRVRFTANDNPNDSVTEAGLDNFSVSEFVCAPPPGCAGDIVDSGTFNPPADGQVDGADLAYLLGEWGPNPGSLADLVDSGTFQPPPDGLVDGADLAYLLGAWGLCD